MGWRMGIVNQYNQWKLHFPKPVFIYGYWTGSTLPFNIPSASQITLLPDFSWKNAERDPAENVHFSQTCLCTSLPADHFPALLFPLGMFRMEMAPAAHVTCVCSNVRELDKFGGLAKHSRSLAFSIAPWMTCTLQSMQWRLTQRLRQKC